MVALSTTLFTACLGFLPGFFLTGCTVISAEATAVVAGTAPRRGVADVEAAAADGSVNDDSCLRFLTGDDAATVTGVVVIRLSRCVATA